LLGTRRLRPPVETQKPPLSLKILRTDEVSFATPRGMT